MSDRIEELKKIAPEIFSMDKWITNLSNAAIAIIANREEMEALIARKTILEEEAERLHDLAIGCHNNLAPLCDYKSKRQPDQNFYCEHEIIKDNNKGTNVNTMCSIKKCPYFLSPKI